MLPKLGRRFLWLLNCIGVLWGCMGFRISAFNLETIGFMGDIGFRIYTPKKENQMDKTMDNEIEAYVVVCRS